MLVLAPEVVPHIISFCLFPFIPPFFSSSLFNLIDLQFLSRIMKVRAELAFGVINVLLIRQFCLILSEL